MSAKLLYTLTEEKTDLHKQIGCMNGFFQIFERHHFLTGRRLKGHKMLPPIPDQSGNQDVEPNSASEKATERNVKVVAKEKQRVSTESSMTSFSSSSCSSSFSSLECNRVTQLEPSSSGQNNFPGNSSRDLLANKPNSSVQSNPQPLDIQDFVKNSVQREARGLSVKTVAKGEAQGHMFKHVDSPRPLQQAKPVKQRNSGLSESSQSATTPWQAPWNSREEKDRSRLLTTRDGSRLLTRDAPRFSFDGRESRDTFKSLKIKDLPRLSLDSRESTIRATNREMKSNYFVQDLQMGNSNSSKFSYQQQELGSYNRPSSVVAKLMGLEAFPSDAETNERQTRPIKTCPDREVESLSRPLDESKRNHMPGSPRNSYKDSISPRTRNAESVTKSTSTSKFPVEPAPWKQIGGRRCSQVQDLKHQDADTKPSNSSTSVYGEIEKRLADIEFKKSGKDLRALKRILEAMQKTKEMTENRKDNQASTIASQAGSYSNLEHSSKLSNHRNLQNSSSAIVKGNSSPRTSRSAIVIMKPATVTDRTNSTAMLSTSTDSISDDQRFQTFRDGRKGSVARHPTKDLTQRSPSRDSSSYSLHSIDINTRPRTPRSVQSSKVATNITEENTNSGKSSGTMSPRLQLKKNGLEKQSSTTPSSDSSRTRRQLSRQPIESASPSRKLKPMSPNSQQGNNQFKKTRSSVRDMGSRGDAISQQSESSTSSVSHTETDTTSTNGSDKNNITFFHHYGQKQKNLQVKFIADTALAEPAVVTLEQPSPISVLDATFYRDESPSPVKGITSAFKDDDGLDTDEVEWIPEDVNHQLQARTPNLSLENDRRKSENIERWISIHGQTESINYIRVLCEHSNPDHRYISKILLASGLLRDLDTGTTTIPFHPSGHPINPNIFLSVEQIMSSPGLSNDDNISSNTSHKNAVEKTQRKLIFDVVNEILGNKLVPEGCPKQRFSSNKQAEGRLKSQQLVREICSEIDQLQPNKPGCGSDDEDDILTSISWGDMMHQSANWSYTSEISGLVLDIERLIFKDLIGEVINGETAGLQTPSGGYCRQLFSM